MGVIRIRVCNKDGTAHLLVSGPLEDAAGTQLARVSLQPGQEHVCELSHGDYYYHPQIKRSSGEFSVEVHMRHGEQWAPLAVDPPSFIPTLPVGNVASFKVP